jgi:hypothetical protein
MKQISRKCKDINSMRMTWNICVRLLKAIAAADCKLNDQLFEFLLRNVLYKNKWMPWSAFVDVMEVLHQTQRSSPDFAQFLMEKPDLNIEQKLQVLHFSYLLNNPCWKFLENLMPSLNAEHLDTKSLVSVVLSLMDNSSKCYPQFSEELKLRQDVKDLDFSPDRGQFIISVSLSWDLILRFIFQFSTCALLLPYRREASQTIY